MSSIEPTPSKSGGVRRPATRSTRPPFPPPTYSPPPPRPAPSFREGGRRDPPLFELVVHHVRDVVGRVEADEIEQRERSHRIAAAELHRAVNVLDRAHALKERRFASP